MSCKTSHVILSLIATTNICYAVTAEKPVSTIDPAGETNVSSSAHATSNPDVPSDSIAATKAAPAGEITTTSVDTIDPAAPKPASEVDPFERFNRVMYNFNDFVDKAALKPVATIYNKVMPKPVSKGITNFFSNLDLVPTVINDVLQLNFYQGANDAWRLGINSTIGIGGFFDVATPIGLEANYEDFGLTLARWGWKRSYYLVIPFLGPGTIRDVASWPVNYELMTVYPHITPDQTRYIVYGVNVVSKRADVLRFENVMGQAAMDKYVFIRDAYLQRRNYRIERNEQVNDPYLEKNSLESEDNKES